MDCNMKTLVFFFAALVAAPAERLFYGDQVLRISPKSNLDVNTILQLENQFPSLDFWTNVHGSRPVDIHFSEENLPAVKAFLTDNRLQYEVFIDDLQVAIDNQVSPRPDQMSLETFNYNVYHSLDEIYQWMDDMAAAYSTVNKITYGTSFEGRPLQLLLISSGGVSKPAFVIDCGYHPREWVATSTCLYIAKYFVEAAVGTEENDLLKVVDIYITPTANPDGYVHTLTVDRMWKKTRSKHGSSCIGVEPNCNWGVNWPDPGSSSNPCSTYCGPSSMSEVEVSSKAKFISGISKVQGYIDVHSYGQSWMHPYGYTTVATPDDAFFRQIGRESVTAIRNVYGQAYQCGSLSEIIHQSYGIATDYMYAQLGIKCAFAAELRDTALYGFTLPERFIQPTAKEFLEGLKVIASYIVSGQCAKIGHTMLRNEL